MMSCRPTEALHVTNRLTMPPKRYLNFPRLLCFP